MLLFLSSVATGYAQILVTLRAKGCVAAGYAQRHGHATARMGIIDAVEIRLAHADLDPIKYYMKYAGEASDMRFFELFTVEL